LLISFLKLVRITPAKGRGGDGFMNNFIRNKATIAFALILIIVSTMLPLKVFGEVQKVTELEDKLSGISEEEKGVLEELFKLQQEIEGMEQQERDAATEIDKRQLQVQNLENQVLDAQLEYNLQLDILKQVLVDYQRRGPASYLEILLNAKNLSEFLASLNIIKDITHNVKELLTTIEDSKTELQGQRDTLVEQKFLLEKSREKLQEKLEAKEELQEERESYLASLQENRAFYEEQLDLIAQMWTDCTTLFPEIVKELTEITRAGYFTVEDLNIAYGLFSVQGYISQEVFQRIFTENSKLWETVFLFQEDKVVIEVPDKHLRLVGNFIVEGDMAIRFEVQEGTFYDMPLEATSLQELFSKGSFVIDFGAITGDMLQLDFTLSEVWSQEGALNFIIIPEYGGGGSYD
jgi:peptidoglycan hydrolase CwlO-like protein